MKTLSLRITSQGRFTMNVGVVTIGATPPGSQVPAIPFLLRMWGSYLDALRYRMQQEDGSGWNIFYGAIVNNSYIIQNHISSNTWDQYAINLLLQDQVLPELDAMTAVRSFSFRTVRLEINDPSYYPMLAGAELRILRGRPIGGFRLENYPIGIGFSPRQVMQNVVERRFEESVFVEPQDIIYLKMPPLSARSDPSESQLELTLTLGVKRDLRFY